MSRLRRAGLAWPGPLAPFAAAAERLRFRFFEKRRRAAGVDRFDIVSGADLDRPLPNRVLTPGQYRSLVGGYARLADRADLEAAETGELFVPVR